MDIDLDEHFAALRGWAQGLYPLMAATELLIRSGWAGPNRSWVRDGTVTERRYRPWIDFAMLGDPAVIGAYSGGEQRFLRIAASLGTDGPDGVRINLSDELSGMDLHHASLVLSALTIATGYGREVAEGRS